MRHGNVRHTLTIIYKMNTDLMEYLQ